MHKVKSILFHALAAFALVIIWGVNLQNAWVSIAGFLGLVAIAFIILTDDDGDTITIPNNMVYQKIVRRMKTSGSSL